MVFSGIPQTHVGFVGGPPNRSVGFVVPEQIGRDCRGAEQIGRVCVGPERIGRGCVRTEQIGRGD